jgi:hypothetical protein
MTYEEKMKFMFQIRSNIEAEPELLGEVLTNATIGMENAIKEANERAIAMESVAMAFSSMTTPKYSKDTDKWAKGLITAKLAKLKDNLRFVWDIETDIPKGK